MPAPSTRHALAAAQAYSPRPLTAGERWTVEALEELRRGGFTAGAWRRFVAASLARSSEASAARPELARQGRAWGVAGAVAWVLVCRLTPSRHAPSTWRGLAWWTAVWQMLDWHLGMAEGGDGRPRERLSPADAVTLARFWMVPLLSSWRSSRAALAVVIGAGAGTDVLDGHLARRYGRTRLGRDLDSTADLVFLLAAGRATAGAGRLSAAGRLAVNGRLAVGVTLSTVAVFGRARRPAIRARRWGGALRFAGLALCAAGRPRTGEPLLCAGCLVPPRSTAPERSRV